MQASDKEEIQKQYYDCLRTSLSVTGNNCFRLNNNFTILYAAYQQSGIINSLSEVTAGDDDIKQKIQGQVVLNNNKQDDSSKARKEEAIKYNEALSQQNLDELQCKLQDENPVSNAKEREAAFDFQQQNNVKIIAKIIEKSANWDPKEEVKFNDKGVAIAPIENAICGQESQYLLQD